MFLIVILWLAMVSIVILSCIDDLKELPSMELGIAITIFAIAAPIFILNAIFILLLDMVMPEGWGEDDDI